MKRLNEKHLEILFIIIIFSLSVIYAVIQPVNAGPDECMKMDICKYIAEHNAIPHGGDKEVLDSMWGISYGFTPILSYIFGGLFMKIAGIFTQDVHAMFVAARLVSCICYSIMGFFVIKLGDKLFKNKFSKWIFISLTMLLPQVLFLGSYINNDSLALLSISIIVYSWVCAIETKWSFKSCVMLAIGIGTCALSYYNAYGYILTSMILFVVHNIARKVDIKEFFKKGAIISIITLAICGWWFVRSYIIYDGDFLGLRTTDEYAEKYAKEDLKPSKRETPQNTGMSLYEMLIENEWIQQTVESFIAIYGGMEIRMPLVTYFAFLLIFLVGFIGYLIRLFTNQYFKNMEFDKKLLFFAFIFNIIIPIILSFYYSYCSDFQPQGRYIISMLIPFMCFITMGIENVMDKIIKKTRMKMAIQMIIIITPLILTINCIVESMKYYMR